MRRRDGLLAALAASAALPLRARTVTLAPGESLQAAVAAAGAGGVVELLAGLHRGQAAVIDRHGLTLRASGGRVVLQADGAHAEGKALLVVRAEGVRVEGLELRGARVAAGNGAGVRFERGSLVVSRCRFVDNEMGLLSANVADAELVVEDSVFEGAPRHAGALHHLLYVGAMKRLVVRGCRLAGGWQGHLLKSRARENLILCNRLVDGDDGESSYQVDLPNGGLAWLVGNVIGKGPRPQNDALVAFGAEGNPHLDSALHAAHNTFINESPAAATVVRHWPERLPPGASLHLANNLVIGDAAPASWGETTDGNVQRPLDDWDRNRAGRTGLRADAPPLASVPMAATMRGRPMAPSCEPGDEVGTRPIEAPAAWRPGAFQPGSRAGPVPGPNRPG